MTHLCAVKKTSWKIAFQTLVGDCWRFPLFYCQTRIFNQVRLHVQQKFNGNFALLFACLVALLIVKKCLTLSIIVKLMS